MAQDLFTVLELLLESHRIIVKQTQANLLGLIKLFSYVITGDRGAIKADAMTLAPDSRSKILSKTTPDREKIITSDQAWKLKRFPHEIAIIGGGYIGGELVTTSMH